MQVLGQTIGGEITLFRRTDARHNIAQSFLDGGLSNIIPFSRSSHIDFLLSSQKVTADIRGTDSILPSRGFSSKAGI